MFGKQAVAHLINRSTEDGQDRRRFLKAAGLAGLGIVGTAAAGTLPMASAADDGAATDAGGAWSAKPADSAG